MKDKPKEDFPKAPTMPEDMKEMYKQRQRELQLERAQMSVDDTEDKTDEKNTTAPVTITEPRLEDKTVAPKLEAPPEPRPNVETPKETKPAPVATPAESRPREVDPNKKRGKKGNDGPPNE